MRIYTKPCSLKQGLFFTNKATTVKQQPCIMKKNKNGYFLKT
jgi:hypothetical protein